MHPPLESTGYMFSIPFVGHSHPSWCVSGNSLQSLAPIHSDSHLCECALSGVHLYHFLSLPQIPQTCTLPGCIAPSDDQYVSQLSVCPEASPPMPVVLTC